MSPVLILSRLCLKRRFQFFGMSEHSSWRTARTLLTVSSSITRRRPAIAAFSVGTMTVMSLWRILIVRYSRRSPSTSFCSFLSTCPAPWWGYTTLSPISNSMCSSSTTISRSSICSSVNSVMMASFSSGPPCSPRWSGLQVTVHEVDLLLTTKALADVLRPNLTNALDGLQLTVAGCQQLLQPAELLHDALHDQSWKTRDATENPVAPRRDGKVECVDLAVVAEQLGEPPEVEQILVRQAHELVERVGEALVRVVGQVVAHERGLVAGDADHRLVKLHLDQAALGAELDDVALDLDAHARHELGALQHGEDVVERRAALELERGEARRDLIEAAAVLVERRERLVGLRKHDGDVLEDVLRAVDVERDDLAPLRDRDHERLGLLADALGRAVTGAGLERQDRRVGRQLDVAPDDLRGVRAEHERAVHLGELVEEGGRVVDVELEPTGEEEGEIVGVADDDQAAGTGVDDVVDSLAQRRPGGDHLECLDEPGLLARLELLFELFPGTWRHTDPILPGFAVFFRDGAGISEQTATNSGRLPERGCSDCGDGARLLCPVTGTQRPQRRTQRSGLGRHDRRKPELASLRDAALGVGDAAQLAGEAELAEAGERRRVFAATRRVLVRAGQSDAACSARDRERDREVGPGLVDAYAADDVYEHVRAADADTAVARQHGQHEREAVAVDAGDDPPRDLQVRLRHECLHLHEQRARALHRSEHDGAGGARRLADETGGGVEHLDEPVPAHLEHARLAGRAEAVLEPPQGAVGALALALELQHAVDEVLEHAWAGERPLLRHVPDEQHGDAMHLRDAHDLARDLAHLPHRAGRAAERARVQRLHRVDDAHVGPLPLQCRQHGREVRLGDRGNPQRVPARKPLGPQLDLRRRLLGRDVEGSAPGPGEVGERHRRERRLADPRRAADQHERAGNDASAEDAVKLADAGRETCDVGRLDLAERDGSHRLSGIPSPTGAAAASCGRPCDGLLDERVPGTAARALAVPARRLVPAVGADVDRAGACHRVTEGTRGRGQFRGASGESGE